jgi:AcrR family transcriptional regulator
MTSNTEPSTSSKPALAPPRRRRQEERSAETRERLIAAAIEAICELGYPEATTTVISVRAGVSRGALQHHFASRADLIIAVIDAVATELNFRLDVAALAAMPLEARVEMLVEHYWRVFDGPMFRAALNIWLAIAGDPVLARRLRSRLGEIQEDIVRSWHVLFADQPRTDAELSSVRRLCMATVRGYAISRMFDTTRSWQHDRGVLCRMVLDALRAEPNSSTSNAKPAPIHDEAGGSL